MPRNSDVADQLDLLADLSEIRGDDSFRVSAYRRAATRVRETAAPVAEKIWDAIYGLQGAKSPLKSGALPTQLPCVRADGTIAPPPCVAPKPAVTRPSPSATTTAHALGMPWAEEARRRQRS